MSSRVGWVAVEGLARVIGGSIRRGSPLATSIGAFVGVAAGYALCSWAGVIGWGYHFAFAACGAILFAVIAAKIFRRPAPLPSDYSWIGAIVYAWTVANPDKTGTSYVFYALTEHAFIRLFQNVLLSEPTPDLMASLHKLIQGEDPGVSAVNVYRLSQLESMELPSVETSINLFWRLEDGSLKCSSVSCSKDLRPQFVEHLEIVLDKKFEETEREMTFWEATYLHWTFLVTMFVMVGGLIWLSTLDPNTDDVTEFWRGLGPRGWPLSARSQYSWRWFGCRSGLSLGRPSKFSRFAN